MVGRFWQGGHLVSYPDPPSTLQERKESVFETGGGGGGGGTVILVIEVLYKLDHDKLCACMSEVALYMCIMS